MFERLGHLTAKYYLLVIISWCLILALLISIAPNWSEVSIDGEFSFLPNDTRILKAEKVFREAFPDDSDTASSYQRNPLGSEIAIVVRRKDLGRKGLQKRDREFIENVLVPRLKEIRDTVGHGYGSVGFGTARDQRPVMKEEDRIVKHVYTESSGPIGQLLTSEATEEGQATLVMMDLETEFLDRSNTAVIEAVEAVLNDPELKRQKPAGLDLALSGSAVVGRDTMRAEEISGTRTENFTRALVVILLLLIYRAPVLAMIPLITVGITTEMTICLLRVMAEQGWINLFTGLEVYVKVVVYGAGVDYCLFLIARYREELDLGNTFEESIVSAVTRVGAALATSAGTSICGIGMMGLADFGKFRQAGFAISFGLFITLCSALLFTPALLRLAGRWAFWPDLKREQILAGSGWMPTTSLTALLTEGRWLQRAWEMVAQSLLAYPWRFFIGTITVLVPFAFIGVLYHNDLSYGLLSDLPQNEPSVIGAKAVQEHYPVGISGETVILVHHPKFDLGIKDGIDLTAQIVAQLEKKAEKLGLYDIRCQAYPFGRKNKQQNAKGKRGYFRQRYIAQHAYRYYTSHDGPLKGDVFRIDMIFNHDPFSRESTDKLSALENAVRESLPEQFRDQAEIYSLGPTASLRELKTVTDRDRVKIDFLVVIAVYLVLVALLRQPAICAYLIVSVAFSYLVTLGVTYCLFWLRDPSGFVGLDWKIPIFLFTILIAMGEDYNILLMARVQEEQEKYGLIGGVIQALTRTGSIISSCGIIMAGTFSALMTGSLLGMVQLGFALAFGVLLDTFVVRPILVPSYLILLYSGQFGRFGKWLGATESPTEEEAPPHATAGPQMPAAPDSENTPGVPPSIDPETEAEIARAASEKNDS